MILTNFASWVLGGSLFPGEDVSIQQKQLEMDPRAFWTSAFCHSATAHFVLVSEFKILHFFASLSSIYNHFS